MPMARVERLSGSYSPVSGTVDETVSLGKQLRATDRVIGFRCNVVAPAGGTNATLTFGRTGTNAGFMAAADVGVRVAGRKNAPTGADLAGGGSVPGAVSLMAAYQHGDNLNAVVTVEWSCIVIKDELYKKLFGV